MDQVFENLAFSPDLPKNKSNVIKVIGVGGGGSNAINHMYNQGINGVDFVVCNTDAQALNNSPVPIKIQLGLTLTEGLGAGANPEVGQQSALESIEEIEQILDTNTKMVFITAGMGGGTGTGAAPVIAQLAKDRDILTVGIVTIPFQFEGKVRQEQALRGVENLRKNVDSLIVINNNKLREVYGNLGFKAGFSKADEVLATASRGIAEVITHHYTQNIDLKDAKTVLSNSGTAIMGSAEASGENRAKEAIVSALDSPLLNDNKITGAKNVLLLIVSGENEITIDEIGEINDHIQMEAGHNANIIMGVGEDPNLGDAISVTIIATGFNVEQQKLIVNANDENKNKIIHHLGEEQKATADLLGNQAPVFNNTPSPEQPLQSNPTFSSAPKIVYNLDDDMGNQQNDIEKKTIVQTQTPNSVENHAAVASPSSEITAQQPQPVQPEAAQNVVKTVDIRNIVVNEPTFVIVKPKQVVTETQAIANEQFSFDLKQQQDAFESNQQEFSFEIQKPVESAPQNKSDENEIIRYDLSDYMEVEDQLLGSKQTEEPVKEEDAFSFTVRTEEPSVTPTRVIVDENASPMETSINDILRERAEERKRKMKEFNHKFNTASNQINDLEKEPAYKRMGVDLTQNPANNVSRTSVSSDRNNDVQLRSNNSFLHDNVD
ncbi:cell division protein FtsZ [Flavobacterium sp. CBA20B-1]|uniref:cell division protein FtsZ n=1 Tax=unclassified Flavobacterium TaxID=196869 RepID=UPI00222554D6|nr:MULTISPECIES: cell division protein FtsZ [unclassified Flavobacterium]WCM41563.1 cell division protein FtsZ [Flavobacterium sp. CBA20B-1]